MTAFTPRHFIIEELLPKSLFEELNGARLLSQAWAIFDERILRHADDCRDAFGTLEINNWHTGGMRNESGLRRPGMLNYSVTSQHSYGRALDMISPHYSAQEMRDFIKANPASFLHVTRIEDGVEWLHSDVANAIPITFFKK